MSDGYTIVAGASGNLGHRIVEALVAGGGRVRALVRRGGTLEARDRLRALGAAVEEVEFSEPASLTRACAGGACVVSALSGLREVIVGAQSQLLDAAVAAGVPRFIPSDYCIDYTALQRGKNRNLDLRAEFRARLDVAPIAATSVLNGMFTDLLVGPAPVVLFPLRRVLYWGDADQPLDFTTIADTALVTAAAALDERTPRFLRVAGDVVNARDWRAPRATRRGTGFVFSAPVGWAASSGSSASCAAWLRGAARPFRRGRGCSICATCSAVAPSSCRSTTRGSRRCDGRRCARC